MNHYQTLSAPQSDQTIPSAVLPSLWSALTPLQQQQLAQGLAELIQRMHRPRTSLSTEDNHDQI